jgi:hypothetical protein
MWMRAVRLWLLLAVAMIANGAVRALLLEPLLGAHVAELVSAGMAIALILLLTRPFIRSIGTATVADAIGLGALWTAMTIAFEFGFGHFVVGASWTALLANYDVIDGRVWPLVIVALAASPFVWRVRPPPRLVPHAV